MEAELRKYFLSDSQLVYFIDIKGFNSLYVTTSIRSWRLFIYSYKRSLKCVLLHKGNMYSSIPAGHSVKLKEEYNNITILF